MESDGIAHLTFLHCDSVPGICGDMTKMDDMAHCGQFRQQAKQPLPIPSRGWKKRPMAGE
jgi:hypothetical protein